MNNILNLQIKNYQQHNIFLGTINSILLFIVLFIARYSVLTNNHVQKLMFFSFDKYLPYLILILSGLWGWFSTTVLCLHDHLHEPFLFKWRAWYDTDFILRSLCYEYSSLVSPDLFERAFFKKRIREKLMQRLFYKFIGDEKGHEGLRRRFYTRISKYWACATLEIYIIFSFIAFSIYNLLTSTTFSAVLILVFIIIFIFSRIYSNTILDRIREITIEQINVIKSEHSKKLKKNLHKVASDLNARRNNNE